MKKTVTVVAMLTAIAAVTLIACTDHKSTPAGEVAITQDSLVKRGSYLVNGMGCDDCHSPKKFGPNGPEIDQEHRFAGHLSSVPLGKIDTAVFRQGWVMLTMDLTAAVGPWGISYAANISSDESGIGSWSEAQFVNALRHGKLKGMDESRSLLPPMPWQSYRLLSDTDIKSIFAYLKTSKPVANVVPAPVPPNQLK